MKPKLKILNNKKNIEQNLKKLKGTVKAAKDFDYKTELSRAINWKYNK